MKVLLALQQALSYPMRQVSVEAARIPRQSISTGIPLEFA